MSDRERLEKIVREARDEWASDDLDDSVSSRIVKHLLAAGVTLPPAPPPVLSERERMAQTMYEDPDDFPAGRWQDVGESYRETMLGYADRLIASGVHLPEASPPASPPPVLEVTEEADKAYCYGYNGTVGAGAPAWRAAGLRAAFPHLLRSCADGLTDEECEAIAAEIGMTDGSGLIRTILRRVAARREA